jgi:nitrogen fixation/metabolism regulation signal transduction histidine kinase
MRARLLPATILLAIVLVDPALAHDNGEGLVGETDDKIVTFFGLAVALFFVVVATVGTLIQQALEKRKEERKAARLRQRTGW